MRFLLAITPGMLLCAAVAIAAVFLGDLIATFLPLPAMLVALIIGMALNPIAKKTAMEAGITFSVKTLLRWSVALLGLRIALYDIAALGPAIAILIVVTMLMTLVAAFVLARWNNQSLEFAALVGASVAVCGASAALAASTVTPNYATKQADLVFVVLGANALATIAMVIYPQISVLLDFDAISAGALLGGAIHDVAQVVASGYSMSEEVGINAVIVKMFRVLLLAPIVLAIGFYFKRFGSQSERTKIPIPVFAFVFVGLCVVNSIVPSIPEILPIYLFVKNICFALSTAGLLVAISALGLSTSMTAIVGLGWRRVATMIYVSAFLGILASSGLVLLKAL